MWVKTTDELPKYRQLVLIYNETDEIFDLAYYLEANKYFVNNNMIITPQEVDYWKYIYTPDSCQACGKELPCYCENDE